MFPSNYVNIELLICRIERLRREVSESQRQQMPSVPANAWPKDCVPVPVETFKRLLADAAAAADAAASAANNQKGKKKKKQPTMPMPMGAGSSSGEENIGGVGNGGDDTSHDVADLSSQERMRHQNFAFAFTEYYSHALFSF